MKHQIQLQDETRLDLILPDGRVVAIEYFLPEEDMLPELDIWFPCDMVANCYADHLKPAPCVGRKGNLRLVRQIVIPIEKR